MKILTVLPTKQKNKTKEQKQRCKILHFVVIVTSSNFKLLIVTSTFATIFSLGMNGTVA